MTRAAGWETRHVELSLDAALELGHEEISQPFTGRIDRVDRHRETGRLRVLDYKTGDEPADPERSHLVGRGTGRWFDMQFPL
ncbi:MAG: PD-(D/E)XK nuclease family protein, partial [Phycisphaerales bacterium]